jgi:hypothetical protein
VTSPVTHNLSPGNIARSVYESSNDTIRVTLVGSGSPTTPSIVTLSDGIGLLSSTVVGADRALDVNIVNALDVVISHIDDSIKIGDGTSLVTTTTSGPKVGLDVSILGSSTFTQAPAGPTVTTFGSSTALTPTSSVTTATYTVPVGKVSYIQKVYLSGTEVGTYLIKLNAASLIKYRTSVTKFSEPIDLSTGSAFGVKAVAGDVISVVSENNGSINGNFDVTIQVMEV